MSRQSRLGYLSQRIKLGISERRRPPAFAAARSAAVRMRTRQPERCRQMDGRARKTESVPAVGRRAFATWATWAKLLDARWALPSARRGTGDPAPNERGQTLPSRATQPRAEAERKRAETHAVSGNITGGDERRTGDVTEDTRLARQPRVGRSGRRDTQTVDCVTGSEERACPKHLALGVGSARGGRGGQSDATSVRPAAPWGHRPPPSSRWLVLALPAVLRAGGALANATGGGEGGGPVRTGS